MIQPPGTSGRLFFSSGDYILHYFEINFNRTNIILQFYRFASKSTGKVKLFRAFFATIINF